MGEQHCLTALNDVTLPSAKGRDSGGSCQAWRNDSGKECSFIYLFIQSLNIIACPLTPDAGPSSHATALSLGVPREPLHSLMGEVNRTPEITVATALGATAVGSWGSQRAAQASNLASALKDHAPRLSFSFVHCIRAKRDQRKDQRKRGPG